MDGDFYRRRSNTFWRAILPTIQKDISRQLESGGQAEGKALAGAVYGLHSGLPARDNFALRRAFVMQMVQRTTTQTLQLELSRSLSSDLSLLAIIASSAHYCMWVV